MSFALLALGTGTIYGYLLGNSLGGHRNYKRGQKELSEKLQKLCEERKITLHGKDSGQNIEYTIETILDEAMKVSKK